MFSLRPFVTFFLGVTKWSEKDLDVCFSVVFKLGADRQMSIIKLKSVQSGVADLSPCCKKWIDSLTKLLRLSVTPKALQLSFYFFFSFSSVLLDGLTKVICVFFFYFSFRIMWPISDLLTSYAVCFQAMYFRKNNSNGWLKLEHAKSCSLVFALHNAYRTKLDRVMAYY